jgi:hypothetical protein
MPSSDVTKKIITDANLQGFFFDGLNSLNRKSHCPVPESAIFYSSDVLDKFVLAQNFFDISEGRVREKILGLKLLEATQLSREDQRRVYKEVADMSLLVCGYFSESTQNKMVDTQYYGQIGKMAYQQLNNLSPSFLDIPSFYTMFATCFESITMLMTMLASLNRGQSDGHLIFKKVMSGEPVSEREYLVSGVIPQLTKKVS